MPGMLDFLDQFGRVNDPNGLMTPEQQNMAQAYGMLALAGPLLEAGQRSPVRQGLGAAFGKGIAGMMQAQRGAQQDAMQQRLFKMKMDEAAREQQDRAGYRKSLDDMGRGRPPMIDLTATPDNPDMAYTPGAEPTIPPQLAALLQFAKPDTVAGAMLKNQFGDEAGKYGLSPFYTEGPGGELMASQLSNRGGISPLKLPPGHRPAPSNQVINLGDRSVVMPSRGMGDGMTLPKGVPPQDQPALRGAQTKATESEKSQAERDEKFTKAQAALQSFASKSDLVMSTIDKTLAHIKENPLLATGWGYKITPANVPGPANQLDNYLMEIKARVGFDQLQAMREASPTGGALGQVSDFENKLLQAINGALDPKERDQLTSNLAIIKDLYPKVMAQKQAAFETDYPSGISRGPLSGGGAPASAPRRIRIGPDGRVIP